MLLRFAFLLFSLYISILKKVCKKYAEGIYNFTSVKFKRREKEDKMEDERKGKKVNERSEKKRRRDKEEDL